MFNVPIFSTADFLLKITALPTVDREVGTLHLICRSMLIEAADVLAYFSVGIWTVHLDRHPSDAPSGQRDWTRVHIRHS